MLLQGDCLEKLKDLPDNSVDSIVTDPPYGLSFMGKKWDYDVPTTEIWKECLRVLKPGGHLLAFFGTRTYHRGVVRIEDAGFEIRDQIQWIYGSGFPKSHDISKGIDKQAGAERPVIGYGKLNPKDKKSYEPKASNDIFDRNKGMHKLAITEAQTDAAKQWQGWGTALKPANEPIVVARKPLEKGLTIAENVQKWGTGALNIDGSRIATDDVLSGSGSPPLKHSGQNSRPFHEGAIARGCNQSPQGRWPANVLFDEEAARVLDEQSGTLKSGSGNKHSQKNKGIYQHGFKDNYAGHSIGGDSGGASRFFYVAKASKKERNAGCEDLPLVEIKGDVSIRSQGTHGQTGKPNSPTSNQNHHPTVKPTKLGVYLQTLVTPPGGVTLDPFMGSGSFGVSAKLAGFQFIGIELSPEYFQIAKQRILITEARVT